MVIRLQGSHAVIAAALAALLLGSVSQCALAQTAKDPAIELPTVTVQGSKKAPVKKSAPTKQTAAEPIASGAALDTTLENKTTVTLDAAPDVGKTGTKLGDLPQSVVVVPKGLVGEQGGTSLRAATRDVSSVNEGGPSSYGFFDRFMIRGMDARIYSDSFPDGDQSNGFPHSLNGVDHIEVLKGPGSALLGSTTPGGSINIVHAVPSSTFGYGTGLQIGSFGTVSNSFYVTGPGSVPGLTYRIDGLLEHADGFRELESANYEIRPVFRWAANDHVFTLALDVRHIERTPDAYGLIYFGSTPIHMPNTTKYSTPFSFGNQDFERVTLADAWTISNLLTINSRLSYTHRDVDILRNAGGTLALTSLTKRQLRQQTDHDDDLTYQIEPVWKFNTGPIWHTLLTGAQVEYQTIRDNRSTADLGNIANVFAPVIPETSTNGLTFLRNAAHSGMVDDLSATYLSLYAADQIDVTREFKLRLSARKDWWSEELTPRVFVPGRIDTSTGLVFQPGITSTRNDAPVSWSAGGLYKLLPGLAAFAGASRSYLTNFNSETTQNGVVAPESGLQYEAGLKLSTPGNSIVLTTAVFNLERTNVFTENSATGVVAFNAQKTTGIDADLQVLVTPKWKILANGVIQEAELTAVPLTPTQVGNKPVGVPLHMLNVWSTYDFEIGGLDGFKIGAGLSYADKTFGNTANTVWIPSSTVVDAMVGYFQPKWDVQVGVKNVADVTYFTTAQSAGGYVGQPRTFYAKADWHF